MLKEKGMSKGGERFLGFSSALRFEGRVISGRGDAKVKCIMCGFELGKRGLDDDGCRVL